MDLKEIIEQIGKDDQQELYSLVCTVDEVNEGERTCKVTPLNGGVAVFGVRLQAIKDNNQGLVVIPTVGSEIIVTFLNKQTGYVALHTKVDKIFSDSPLFQFNGGDNGGLINIADLVDKINQLENALNGHITIFNTHIHITTATVGTGSPGIIAPTTPGDTSNTIAPTTLKIDLEDDAVTH